jgi:hypothetical protein
MYSLHAHTNICTAALSTVAKPLHCWTLQEPLFDPASAAAQATYVPRRGSSITPVDTRHSSMDMNNASSALSSSPTNNTNLPSPPAGGTRGGSFNFGNSSANSASNGNLAASGGNLSLSPGSHRRLGSREDNKRAREGASGNSRVHQVTLTVLLIAALMHLVSSYSCCC